MEIQSAIGLGLIQGLTEFLPISSSGHLILAESLMQLDFEQMKAFDIAVHLGTLLAVLIYFWKDILGMVGAATAWIIRKNKMNDHEKAYLKLIKFLILGTIPAIVIGLLFGDIIDVYFRNPVSVAILLMAVGLMFFGVEKAAARINEKQQISLSRALLVGMAQTLALIPGVSRSGITISAGLLTGMSREKAAKFSFLLGFVAILAASILAVYKSVKGDFILPDSGALIAGILSSMLSGLVAIAFLMKFLKNNSLAVFGWYRLLAGLAFLTIYFYF